MNTLAIRSSVLLLCCAGVAASAQDAARAYEAELAADAASRTSLAGEGGGAGYEKGKFSIYDGSKSNLLWIAGHIQTRYEMNFRDEDSVANDSDDFTHGFSIRRTRLRFGGNIWDKALTYQVQLDGDRSTGDITVIDAYAQYKYENGIAVRWGQFKLPFLREESISDNLQLAAETSVTHSVFTQSRSQGVQIEKTADNWRIVGAFSDGFRTLNTSFDSAAESDYALTARFDWMFAGNDFKRFDDFTSFRNQEFAGDVGFAVHYQSGGETGGTLDRNSLSATLDTQLEGKGWNAFAAAIYRDSEDDSVSDQQHRQDYGLVIQGGLFVSDQAELFARGDILWQDSDRRPAPTADDTFRTITGGVNYYISPESHAFKFTGEVQYYIDPESDSALVGRSTALGLLPDTEGGQFHLRLQLQVMF
jgi:hypothetical protein